MCFYRQIDLLTLAFCCYSTIPDVLQCLILASLVVIAEFVYLAIRVTAFVSEQQDLWIPETVISPGRRSVFAV